MNKLKWNIKPKPDGKKVQSICDELSVDYNIGSLLVQRGIETFEQAKHFFRPSLADLHDPYLMQDMDKAIDRIERAMGDGERIIIYGDYDVDGTTAVSLVYSFFLGIYDNVSYYIPDRYKEGYGISLEGIDHAEKEGVSLIIALDCGIRAIDQIEYAKKKQIDFIICDHHLPGEKIPAAHAVLDPKRSDCNYPYKELSGCGIGFKLVQAFAMKHAIDDDKLIELLDLTAISIACDIVPLTGENRILAHFGLLQVNEHPRPAISEILRIIEVDRILSIRDLVFIIGPRINAAGRMKHGQMAVELLIEKDAENVVELCKNINLHNDDRRTLDQTITQEALAVIEGDEKLKKAKTSVVFHEDWHKGVIGIVASRLIESYYRPTIVLTSSNGLVTGSARSVKGFDVHEAICQCSELLTKYGGHKYAAGLTMPIENVALFQEKFEQVVAASITDEQLVPQLEIDLELKLAEITPKFYRLMKQFAPFGPRNMTPVFMSREVMNAGYSKKVGAEGDHLKLHVFQKGNTNITFNGIAFNYGEHFDRIATGEPFNIAYCIEENEWNGNISLQLRVRDIQFPND